MPSPFVRTPVRNRMRSGLRWPLSIRASSSRDTTRRADSSIAQGNDVLFETLAALAGQSGKPTFSSLKHIQDSVALAQHRSINVGDSADRARLFDADDGSTLISTALGQRLGFGPSDRLDVID